MKANMVEFDASVVKELCAKKQISHAQLAEDIGLSYKAITTYMREGRCQLIFRKSVASYFGVDESILIPIKQKSATEIIQNHDSDVAISEIKSEVQALRNDLSMMAKMLIQINKTVAEGKAQAELNHDDIVALDKRVTEVSSNVAKIYGKLNHRY